MAQMHVPLLAPLLVEQQGVQQGAPGGLVQSMDPAAHTEGLRFAEKSRPKNVSTPAVMAPDAQDVCTADDQRWLGKRRDCSCQLHHRRSSTHYDVMPHA